MPSFNDISTLSLGNTFGAWYNKTNEIINQVNLLDVASITGGDGILISDRPSPFTGGYTVEFSGNVTKNTTFAGNVSIAGTLTFPAKYVVPVVNTTTLLVPPIVTLALPPEAPMLTSLVPLKILVVKIPLAQATLPKK